MSTFNFDKFACGTRDTAHKYRESYVIQLRVVCSEHQLDRALTST